MNRINLLWTTDNKDTAITMIAMYAANAKKNAWWDEVQVIIWGASSKLVADEPQIQAEIAEMLHHGVHIEACKACADNFGVTEKLEKIGINVRYWGEPLTKLIKSGEHLITI